MLVLMRSIDQKIVIDDDIAVTILGVNGRQIKIGIEAPDDVNIVRSELLPGDDTDSD